MNNVLERFQELKKYIDENSLNKESLIRPLNKSILGNKGLSFEFESNKLSILILFWDSGIIDISSIFIDDDNLANSKEILNYIYNPTKMDFLEKSISILDENIKIIKKELQENYLIWANKI
ncbi:MULTISPECIES: hypothetical protein [Chryseobacterium]|uniref:hypothetical protein n=1 Tax=Chryseobacterium TaxID=59732 RepID=UPI002796C97E|nr:hypothetical protein [Chryseobacterium sp. WLY505]MDQ1858025.1 hypothetical protein [Chryseobacterium sp. WLY505]